MRGYVATWDDFLMTDTTSIVAFLQEQYPEAERAQIDSWRALIDTVKAAAGTVSLPAHTVIAIEYALATDGMAIDLLLAGTEPQGQKAAIIVESKRWSDDYLKSLTFSAYREEGRTLHPQIQVDHHRCGFRHYLDIGEDYRVYPFVFLPYASVPGMARLVRDNPLNDRSKAIPVHNRMEEILETAASLLSGATPVSPDELMGATYCPSRTIIDAMEAIVTKETPFLLTPEQREVFRQVNNAIAAGKRIIRINGAAGSGKTAILLNLYVHYLQQREAGIRPVFLSGAQNTAFYRSRYPTVAQSFTYSYSLDRTVPRKSRNRYILLMDEAQHNQSGIITEMVERGATLVVCFDHRQVINANNSLAELAALEQRPDFAAVTLIGSVRFNGSTVAEENIHRYLDGRNDFLPDEAFDFRCFDNFETFQQAVLDTIRQQPEATVAVTGLMSGDHRQFTTEQNNRSVLFAKWGYKAECDWLPYVRGRDYLSKNDGKLWVGTWWMPGLDVDYIAVIVSGDAVRTPHGIEGVPRETKCYQTLISVARELGLPDGLFPEKKPSWKTAADILNYLDRPENTAVKARLHREFSGYIRNLYYILMTRGSKGCFVYFANDRKEI